MIVSDTVIIGGCGCEADIQMGMVDGSEPSRIGTDGDPVKLTNTAYIAGQGQIGDSEMTLVNVGVIEADGGTLILDTGTNLIVNAGSLEAGPNSTLDVNSAINNFWEITAFGASVSTLLGSPTGGDINLNGAVKNFGLITAEAGASIDVTGDIKNFGGIDVDGSFTATGSVHNDAAGGFTANGDGLIDVTGDFINKGFIAAFDDSSILLHGAVNNALGEMTADGGLILVGSTVGASGMANIIDDGTIHFEGAARSFVDFSGDEGGTLILDDASTFKGSVAGFDDTDMIQFKDLVFGSDVEFRYIESQNLLKIFENGVLDSKLYFDGTYTDADFQMIDDGTGHVAIQYFDPLIQ